MSNISLLRVDDRLVHGQVVTKWLQKSGAKSIIIVDDNLSKNSYLTRVFKMAAPRNIDITVFSASDFVEKHKTDSLGPEKLLILFKSIDVLKDTFDQGFSTDTVQIGGVGSSAERKMVFESIALSEDEAKKLLEIEKLGTKIEFQRTPEDRLKSLDSIVKKSFKKLI